MATRSPTAKTPSRRRTQAADLHDLPGGNVPRSLPRGLNPLPRDVVVRSQRTRIKQALAASVAEKGYAATTVADITALAGVSRTTFYEQFKDKEDCYLVCFEDQIRFITKRMQAVIDRADPPPAQLVKALAAFVDTVAAEPVYSMAYMGLAMSVGQAFFDQLVDHKARVLRIIQPIATRAAAWRTAPRKLPPEILEMTIHGMYEFIASEVRAGRCETLGRQLPLVCYLWFSTLGFPDWAATALASTSKALRQMAWPLRAPAA
ncbi:MAG: TetR/AcrR family transcriptional regulator [Pseudomonadota bacterium]